jgi:hypothetical protein
MSTPEVARAIKTDEARAQTLIDSVTRKLSGKSLPNRIPVCVW